IANPHSPPRRRRCPNVQNRPVSTTRSTRAPPNPASAALGEGQLQAGGSKDVPRVIRSNAKLRTDIEPAPAWHALDLLQCGINILRRVKRLGIGVTTVLANPRMQRVLLLQMRGVLQQYGC